MSTSPSLPTSAPPVPDAPPVPPDTMAKPVPDPPRVPVITAELGCSDRPSVAPLAPPGGASRPVAVPMTASGAPVTLDGELPRLSRGCSPERRLQSDDRPHVARTLSADDLAHLPTLPDAATATPAAPTGAAPTVPPETAAIPRRATLRPGPNVTATATGTVPTLPPEPGITASADSPSADADIAPAAGGEADPASPVHPMAHLMPQKTAPSGAARRAATIRAAKKARARRIKIAIAIVAAIVAAVAGPALYSWVSGSIDDAGSAPVEQTTG